MRETQLWAESMANAELRRAWAYSATVLAPTATEADALSTAFFVAGATFTESYCAKRKDVAAFLVLEKGESGGYELASFNFEPGTLRLVDGR